MADGRTDDMRSDLLCIGPSDGVAEGQVRLIDVEGQEVGVLRIGGQLRCFENHCPHQGGPVCLGDLAGRVEAVLDERRRVICQRESATEFDLVCPWHGYVFDALTGSCPVDRRLRLRAWPVFERDGRIYLSRPPGGGGAT